LVDFDPAAVLFVVAVVRGVLPSIRDDVVFKVLLAAAAAAVVFVGGRELTLEATTGLALGTLAGVLAAVAEPGEALAVTLAVTLAVLGLGEGAGEAVLAGAVLADGTVDLATRETLAGGEAAAAFLGMEVCVFEDVVLAGLKADIGRADKGVLGVAVPAVAVAGLAGVVSFPAAAPFEAVGIDLPGDGVAFEGAEARGFGDNCDKGFLTGAVVFGVVEDFAAVTPWVFDAGEELGAPAVVFAAGEELPLPGLLSGTARFAAAVGATAGFLLGVTLAASLTPLLTAV
jgi:hypothetical protein